MTPSASATTFAYHSFASAVPGDIVPPGAAGSPADSTPRPFISLSIASLSREKRVPVSAAFPRAYAVLKDSSHTS